jgi:hypothetical protein
MDRILPADSARMAFALNRSTRFLQNGQFGALWTGQSARVVSSWSGPGIGRATMVDMAGEVRPGRAGELKRLGAFAEQVALRWAVAAVMTGAA